VTSSVMVTIPPRGMTYRAGGPGSAYGSAGDVTGNPGRPGPGRGRPVLRWPGPGDQPVDELRAGAGRLVPAGPGLHPGRQPDLRARRATAGRAGGRRPGGRLRVRAVRLGDGGGDRGVPVAAARRPRAGLARPVL